MKITYTIGPSSKSDDIIRALLKNASSFRLNSSHLSPRELRDYLTVIHEQCEREKKEIPVVVDLQGAKMRVGKYTSTSSLPDKVRLTLDGFSSSAGNIPVPHPELFQAIQTGDILTLNDGKVQIQITDRKDRYATATVLHGDTLSSYKGINRPNHPVPYTEITKADLGAIETALEFPFTEFAMSFIVTGEEASLLREHTQNRRLIAKLERPEAMPHITAIDSHFDEIWFCRGDMGAQAGLSSLGKIQDAFTASFESLKHPKYLAGQVLEYMTHFPEPTRSEVVHLYDIMNKGFDGIVLSDETAIGKNPVSVAEFLDTLSL